MKRFNLIDEAWIPVRLRDGSRGELGIWETLRRAEEIAAIEDPSPLVTAALHRLLLAVLYRALEGPCDIEEAKALFESGFPIQRIEHYLETWRERFWLFHDSHPFGQHTGVDPKELEPWTKLTHEHNSTSNKVLFDHTNTREPEGQPAAPCARWLVSTMGFSISGGRGYYPSPSPNAVHCMAMGRHLRDTLLFNLVPYAGRALQKEDKALWETEQPGLPLTAPKRGASGTADLYTWQARFLKLEEEPNGLVRRVRFIAGWGYDRERGLLDPMQAHRMDPKDGPMPIGFRENRATWRDFPSLMPAQAGEAPATVQHAITLCDGNSERLPRAVQTLGLKYEPPNALLQFWRMEVFTLPKVLAQNPWARVDIEKLLERGESSQKALYSACSSFADLLVARGDRKPQKSDIQNFIAQMPCIPAYWARLEGAFHALLQALQPEADPEEVRRSWLQAIRAALHEAWALHASSARRGDVWSIRALVRADGIIARELKKLDQDIHEIDAYLAKEIL